MSYDLGTAHGKIELDYTGKSAVDRAEADMDRLKKGSKNTDGQLKKFGQTLKKVFAGAGTAGKFSAIGVGLIEAGAAAANLVTQLLGMVPALTSILSLSSALPGAFVGLLATIGVLKAAFAGVGDAIKTAFSTKAGSAEKFKKELEQLSPEARKFALAVKAIAPALKNYQQGIQDAFFRSSGLTTAVGAGRAALDQLRPSILGLATDFGRLTKTVTDFATSRQSVAFVSDALVAFRQSLVTITPTLTPILNGLRAVGSVGLPLLQQLGNATAGVATKFGNWLNSIASDGRLQGWIDTALATMRQLGAIVSNVSGIFSTLFTLAGNTGANFLATLESLTGALNTFLQSAQGQQAVTAFFTGVAAVAGQLAPIVTTLAGALAGALGPALSQIANVLGPVLLQIVQALAPAFGPLAQAIADLVSNISPLLPPLAQLVALLAGQLGAAVTALANEFGPLVQVLGSGLSTALATITPLFEAFNQNLPLTAEIGKQLGQAFAQLLPTLIQVGDAFLTALAPSLPQLAASAAQLLPLVVQLAQAFVELLNSGLQQLIPMIPTIVQLFIGFGTAMIGIESAILRTATALIQFTTFMSQLPANIANAINAFGSAIAGGFTSAYNFVVNLGGQILAWFQALPGRVISAVSGFVTGFPSLTRQTLNDAAFAVGAGIGRMITFFVTLPGRAAAAIASLTGLVGNIISQTWNNAVARTTSGIASAIAIARTLPGRARSAIAALPGQIASVATNAASRLVSAISSGISNAVSTARALPGRVRGAIGNLGGVLVSAGRDLVMGLVNGIRGAIGEAVRTAVGVGQSVINGIKSTLKISSPSRVMIQIGRFIAQGLVAGLTGSASQIKSASNKLANYINDAFSAKAIKRNQRNNALAILSSNTKRLLSLVNQSNSVAARLKTAQANLKAVQDAYAKAQTDAAQKVRESFDLVTPGQTFVNLDLLQQRFQDTVNQAKDFATNIARLSKRGVDKDLLQQLADAGATDGSVVARALANASDAQLKAFNSLSSQLRSASGTVGKTVADSLYGAGVRAAQGLVKGLQDQQAAIDKQMLKIANSMANAIKKALKIKSPSVVMFRLGQFITRGLINGLVSLTNRVRTAAQSLADSAVAPSFRLGNMRPATSSLTGFAPAAGASTVNNFNQTVNALPGMSARQVGDYSLTKIRLSLATGVGAVSLPTPAGA